MLALSNSVHGLLLQQLSLILSLSLFVILSKAKLSCLCDSFFKVSQVSASLLDFLLPRAQPPGQAVDTVPNALQALRQNRSHITRTKPWSYHGRTQHRGSIFAIDLPNP
jgi:hypothetical protein